MAVVAKKLFKQGSKYQILPKYDPETGKRDLYAENQEYWEHRTLDSMHDAFKSTDEMEKAMKKHYLNSIRDLKKDINDFYNKYSADNKISIEDAHLALDKYELKEFQASLKEIKINTKYSTQTPEAILEYNKQVKALRTRKRIERYEALMVDVQARLYQLGAIEQEELENLMVEVYGKSHNSVVNGIINSGLPYKPLGSTLDVKMVEKAILHPWDGRMFSDSIWGKTRASKVALLETLDRELTRGMIQGLNSKEIAKAMEAKLGTGYKNSLRLARTETTYIANTSHLDSFKEAGWDRFQFSAHLDKDTSSQCRENNNKDFAIEEAVVGLNVPPLHPNCRSVIIPFFDFNQLEKDGDLVMEEDPDWEAIAKEANAKHKAEPAPAPKKRDKRQGTRVNYKDGVPIVEAIESKEFDEVIDIDNFTEEAFNAKSKAPYWEQFHIKNEEKMKLRDYVAEQGKKFEGGFTPDEIEAVKKYSGSHYQDMGEFFFKGKERYSRKMGYSHANDIERMIEEVNKTFDKTFLTENTTTLRGIMKKEAMTYDDKGVGDYITFQRYKSSALDMYNAETFTMPYNGYDGVYLKLYSYEGQPAIYMDKVMSEIDGEHEILIPAGARYRILKKRVDKDNNLIIEMVGEKEWD